MNGLVLDASVALSWALNEQHPSSEEILERCVAGFVVVPSLFLTELQNGLVMAKRRQRILNHRADKFWSDMIALDLRVWVDGGTSASGRRTKVFFEFNPLRRENAKLQHFLQRATS